MAPSTTIVISLFLHLLGSAATAARPGYGGAAFPVYKDETGTQRYYSTLQIGTPPKTANFTLTLSSQLLWYICQRDGFNSTTYRPVRCESEMCLAATKGMTGCRSCCEAAARPGCTNETCTVMAFNPYDDIKTAEMFYTDVLRGWYSSGSVLIQNYHFLCAGDAMYYLHGLPRGNKGMLGLAMSKFSLPAAVSAGLKLPEIFALCLPAHGTGKLLVGGGPYDGLGKLMQTRILINPYSTAPVHGSREESYEYFIGVTSIKVGALSVKLNKTLLTFHDYGYGGTKLSTDAPYTTLQRDIYEPVVDQFTKAAEEMGSERVGNVGKFSACFSIGKSETGPAVPTIDLVLDKDEVYWRMQGSELMVRVSESVSCLGVVDGGEKPRTSVVIGGLQMEERLVEFDLAGMLLRFSSSLRQQNATCSRSF